MKKYARSLLSVVLCLILFSGVVLPSAAASAADLKPVKWLYPVVEGYLNLQDCSATQVAVDDAGVASASVVKVERLQDGAWTECPAGTAYHTGNTYRMQIDIVLNEGYFSTASKENILIRGSMISDVDLIDAVTYDEATRTLHVLTGALPALKADPRYWLDSLQISVNYDIAPTLGGTVPQAEDMPFVVDTSVCGGAEASFMHWEKQEGTNWSVYSKPTFEAGTYRAVAKVYTGPDNPRNVAGNDNTTYRLEEHTRIQVRFLSEDYVQWNILIHDMTETFTSDRESLLNAFSSMIVYSNPIVVEPEGNFLIANHADVFDAAVTDPGLTPVADNKYQIAPGKEIRCAAVPETPNQIFEGWEATGITLTEAQKQSPEIQFVMPEGDVTVTAKFRNPISLTPVDLGIYGFEDGSPMQNATVKLYWPITEPKIESIQTSWEKPDPLNPGSYIPMLPTDQFVLGEQYVLHVVLHANDIYDPSYVKSLGVLYSIHRELNPVIDQPVTAYNFEAGTDRKTYEIDINPVPISARKSLITGVDCDILNNFTNQPITGKVPYGDLVKAVPHTIEGKVFDHWESDDLQLSETDSRLPELVIGSWNQDIVVKAIFKDVDPVNPDNPDPQPTTANYTVKHMQEKLGTAGNFEEVTADTQTLTGKVGENTAAQAKTYEGFTAEAVTQAEIKADGTTVVEIKYTRNIHTLTFDPNGGKFEGSESVALPYGTPITAPKVVRDGFTFDGWKPAVPENMPDEDVIYVAQWTTTSNTHTLTKVEGCEPTPGSDGWKSYYECSCGKFYEDKDGKKEITNLREWKQGDGKLPALGYKFLEGMNATWKQYSRKYLTFRVNGGLDCFVSIEVDGKTVDCKNYSVESGSTIVKLKHEYLQGLKVGTHTLTANFTDGECETQFTVAAAPKPVSPQTGDESRLLMWSLVSMVSLAAAMVMTLPRKKREK